jgi:dynactin complex subunit
VSVGVVDHDESQDALVAHLLSENAALTARLANANEALERLRAAYTHALEELLLHKRRLFVAKAERFESPQEQLAFEALLEKITALSQQIQDAEDAAGGNTVDPRAAA